MRIGVIIPAAGFGQRFGHELPKQYHLLDQAPIIVHTLRTVLGIDSVVSVVVAISPSDTMFAEICSTHHITDPRLHATVGGSERQHSIMNALNHPSIADVDVILVHDAVRPLASDGLFTRVALTAFEKGACVPVISVDDTIKRVEGDQVVGTVPRADLRRVQTPQGFTPEVLRTAYEQAVANDVLGTDDASLVEGSGVLVYTVDGEPWNTKITTPFDLAVASSMLSRNS
ncbi:MAG: 2-C-methyl-D-erythritol 4-phosphate cytidylyltransferase [Ignavibacteriae bacterium]|jgi:2-C-methyl-D-erythritol 4-phosphate cytidylyltransferase|nr:MAG: 2-C-methyl-D-erythritol 4-phosphate cytidylyltransferase [Ignavibacteriota bacterium]